MRITIDTKYIRKHSAQLISISFTCKDFYIMKDRIIFDRYTYVLLDDVITVKSIINGYQSTLYDNEKKKIILTSLDNKYIATKLDNVKSVLEEIKRSVIE